MSEELLRRVFDELYDSGYRIKRKTSEVDGIKIPEADGGYRLFPLKNMTIDGEVIGEELAHRAADFMLFSKMLTKVIPR